MKMWFYRGASANFGDELNQLIWPQVFGPDFFDQDESTLFLGIGSILLDSHPATSRKVVLGAGFGGYTAAPDVHDGSWDIFSVRGPRTADALGLPRSLSVADSAILIRTMDLPPPRADVGVAFMPHFQSLERGRWAEVCAVAGVTLIDPTGPVDEILAQLQGADVLITEAMHGAIVADALRTPWIATTPILTTHRSKWFDWAESLDITLRSEALVPSSIEEFWSLKTGHDTRNGRVKKITNFFGASLIDRGFINDAAAQLRKLAQREPQLSKDRNIEDATNATLDAVARVKAAYR